MGWLQFLGALFSLPGKIDSILEKIGALEARLKEYQDAEWVKEAQVVKKEFETAANMDEVREVLSKLSSLQRRT